MPEHQQQPIPFVDLREQYVQLERELTPVISRVLHNGDFIQGPNVQAFEREFGSYTGSPHIVGCGNGSDALEMVFRLWGVGEGDEVIVPANTWITSISSATQRGATPVFVDTNAQTGNLDVGSLKRHLTPRTRVIVVVHLGGHAADVEAIVTLAREHGVRVLEDCAQAHGTRIGLRHVGTFGDAATFSFYPGKNLGAYGDAGAIAVSRDDAADLLRRLGNHGQSVKHDHRMEGRNSRLDELQAAVLRVKLAHLAQWIAARRLHAMRYTAQLSDLPITLPAEREGTTSSWHLYTIRCARRDQLREFLAGRQIATNVHYPVALPLVPAYAHLGHQASEFPNACTQAAENIALPMYAELTHAQVDRVCGAIRAFFHD